MAQTTVTKFLKGNPTSDMAPPVSGSSSDTKVSNDTYMVFQKDAGETAQIDFDNWELFTEANRQRIVQIKITIEDHASASIGNMTLALFDWTQGAFTAPASGDRFYDIITTDVSHSFTYVGSPHRCVSTGGVIKFRIFRSGTQPANGWQWSIDLIKVEVTYDDTTSCIAPIGNPTLNGLTAGGYTNSIFEDSGSDTFWDNNTDQPGDFIYDATGGTPTLETFDQPGAVSSLEVRWRLRNIITKVTDIKSYFWNFVSSAWDLVDTFSAPNIPTGVTWGTHNFTVSQSVGDYVNNSKQMKIKVELVPDVGDIQWMVAWDYFSIRLAFLGGDPKTLGTGTDAVIGSTSTSTSSLDAVIETFPPSNKAQAVMDAVITAEGTVSIHPTRLSGSAPGTARQEIIATNIFGNAFPVPCSNPAPLGGATCLCTINDLYGGNTLVHDSGQPELVPNLLGAATATTDGNCDPCLCCCKITDNCKDPPETTCAHTNDCANCAPIGDVSCFTVSCTECPCRFLYLSGDVVFQLDTDPVTTDWEHFEFGNILDPNRKHYQGVPTLMRDIESITLTFEATNTGTGLPTMRVKDYADAGDPIGLSTFGKSTTSGQRQSRTLNNSFISADFNQRFAGWLVGRLFPGWYPGQEQFDTQAVLACRTQFFADQGGSVVDGTLAVQFAEIALSVKVTPPSTVSALLDAVIGGQPPDVRCQLDAIISRLVQPPPRDRHCLAEINSFEILSMQSLIKNIELKSVVRQLDLESQIQDLELQSEVRTFADEE